MLKKSLDYLITVVDFSQEKIFSLVKKTNIKGHVLVGNQKSKAYSEMHFDIGDAKVDVYNLDSKGVSLNRNFLLIKSQADYVTFLDDDIFFSQNYLESIKVELDKEWPNNYSIRFNVSSLNNSRRIKQINKSKNVSLFDLRQYGVWGVLFNRKYLINNNLFFREYIGPGTSINHGEDYIFLSDYFKSGGKIWQSREAIMHAEQQDSTWQGKNRDIKKELFAHGHNYRLLYKKRASIYLLIHMLKHIRYYKNKEYSFFKTYKLGLEGIRFRKDIEKGLRKYE